MKAPHGRARQASNRTRGEVCACGCGRGECWARQSRRRCGRMAEACACGALSACLRAPCAGRLACAAAPPPAHTFFALARTPILSLSHTTTTIPPDPATHPRRTRALTTCASPTPPASFGSRPCHRVTVVCLAVPFPTPFARHGEQPRRRAAARARRTRPQRRQCAVGRRLRRHPRLAAPRQRPPRRDGAAPHSAQHAREPGARAGADRAVRGLDHCHRRARRLPPRPRSCWQGRCRRGCRACAAGRGGRRRRRRGDARRQPGAPQRRSRRDTA
jgi:hypothetical protein